MERERERVGREEREMIASLTPPIHTHTIAKQATVCVCVCA